jgi:hypothetical protein
MHSCLLLRSSLDVKEFVQIYAVGSSSYDGIYLLDFHPDTSSACHVDYK